MSRRRTIIGATALALAAAALTPVAMSELGGPASAAHATTHAPALFAAAPAAASRLAVDTSQGTPERARYVSFRSSLLPTTARGQQLDLPFFDDAQFTATVNHVDHQQLFTSWSGPLDTTYGTFVATRSGDIFSVTANTLSGTYTMTRTPSGLYQVQEATPPRLYGADQVDPTATTGPAGRTASTAATTATSATSATSTAAARQSSARKKHRVKGGDDGSVQDILVMYTPQAAATYGGDAGIAAEAAKNIAYTNAAYANSGIKTSVRLVGVAPTATSDHGVVVDDIAAFTKRGDGKFDEVFKYLKRTHADDSILLEGPAAADASACGVANLTKHQPAKYAFGVVATGDCTNGFPTFPHELGHNQGATHDVYTVNSGQGGSNAAPEFPYGYGYVAPNFAWHTVMAYPLQCIEQGGVYCPDIFNFSNPAVGYGGQTTGTSSTNDVAKLINKTRKRMARHQQSTLYVRGRIGIKPAPRFHHGRVHVTFNGWINSGVHTTFQWYRNGKKIKGAHGRTYLPTRKDVGKQLAVVVTGKKRHYAPVKVGSGTRTVKGTQGGHHHKRRTSATNAATAAGVALTRAPGVPRADIGWF